MVGFFNSGYIRGFNSRFFSAPHLTFVSWLEQVKDQPAEAIIYSTKCCSTELQLECKTGFIFFIFFPVMKCFLCPL